MAVEPSGTRACRAECGPGGAMKTTILPEHPDAKSPAGADIRFVMACEAGNMIHSTVPPQQVNRATMHATVSELWFVLEGRGEIWRADGDESCVAALMPGTSVDIPVGTAFQYRNTGRGSHVHLRLHAALAGRLGRRRTSKGSGRPRSDRTGGRLPRAGRTGLDPSTPGLGNGSGLAVGCSRHLEWL